MFLLCLLFINPIIKNKTFQNIKPILSVLVDNSISTRFFKEDNTVKSIIADVKNNVELNNKFDVNYFSFGSSLNVLDSLSFSESQTDISEALESVNKLYKNNIAPVLLISDGNQTIGNDYEFINSKQTVYPLIIGDTAMYKDVSISQLNVNKYNYIKNKFPVESLLFYEGNEEVNTKFNIYSNGKIVFSKNIRFSPTDNVKTISTNLSSNKEGVNYYTASIQKLDNEKNIINNKRNFSVEVINEQTKILILTSFLHPDIGALKKAIESNKQRSVDVLTIDNKNIQIKDYQLVIMYQPNNKFNKIFTIIKKENSNTLVITGSKTDWSFVNNQQLGFSKNAIAQTENYEAIYSDQFLTFFQKDINFESFPPLLDKFGEVALSKEHETLLYQKINGITSKQPLLATFDINNQKSAVLLGEGIWKWRSASYLNQTNFQDFDEFIGNIVQFLASNKIRKRLDVITDNLYPANATITMNAFYTDKNYKFDKRANLWLQLVHETNKTTKKLPFSLVNNSYQIDLEGLKSGEYSYSVSVENQKVKKYGKFKVTKYQVEELFTNSNKQKLQKLADNAGGKLFHSDSRDQLIQELLNDEKYYTTQKSTIKEQNLIDWKWILCIAVLLLVIEWFIRKYYGKI